MLYQFSSRAYQTHVLSQVFNLLLRDIASAVNSHEIDNSTYPQT